KNLISNIDNLNNLKIKPLSLETNIDRSDLDKELINLSKLRNLFLDIDFKTNSLELDKSLNIIESKKLKSIEAPKLEDKELLDKFNNLKNIKLAPLTLEIISNESKVTDDINSLKNIN